MKTPARKFIAFYFNPTTQLWARATKAAEAGQSDAEELVWKEFTALIPRHQTKLSMLLMLDPAPSRAPSLLRLEGVGGVRLSRQHKGLIYYKLYDESWRKEL